MLQSAASVREQKPALTDVGASAAAASLMHASADPPPACLPIPSLSLGLSLGIDGCSRHLPASSSLSSDHHLGSCQPHSSYHSDVPHLRINTHPPRERASAAQQQLHQQLSLEPANGHMAEAEVHTPVMRPTAQRVRPGMALPFALGSACSPRSLQHEQHDMQRQLEAQKLQEGLSLRDEEQVNGSGEGAEQALLANGHAERRQEAGQVPDGSAGSAQPFSGGSISVASVAVSGCLSSATVSADIGRLHLTSTLPPAGCMLHEVIFCSQANINIDTKCNVLEHSTLEGQLTALDHAGRGQGFWWNTGPLHCMPFDNG